MKSVAYLLVCFVQLLAVSYGQSTPSCGQIDLLNAAAPLPTNGVNQQAQGFQNLSSSAYELEDGRTEKIELKNDVNTIATNLDLSKRRGGAFSLYTMLRLFPLRALSPDLAQTQTLFSVRDKTNSTIEFSVSLRVTSHQTLKCLTCVKILLVLEYVNKKDQKEEIVLQPDFSPDLNDDKWHNLNIEVTHEQASVESALFSTQVTSRVDCRDQTPAVRDDSDIKEPSLNNAVVVIGGEGSNIFRGYLQDFYFSTDRFQCIKDLALKEYCPTNACTVDCQAQTAGFQRQLQSVLNSNDQVSKDIRECEEKPITTPAPPKACSPSDTTNGDGTCTRCHCARQGQTTCTQFFC
jgi:hypothetical protein